jgi:hypothetical protein
MDHFMRADLVECLAAICLYPLLVFIPGYVIGWLADLFDFRRRTPEFRIAVSVPLSISTCPVLIYLAGRFASLAVAEGLIAFTGICFAVLIVRRGLGWPRVPRTAYWIVLAWLTITLFISVDLQIGARDYYPVTAFDYAVRSEFIHSIGVTGIPPANPFFFPGHAAPLRYHYFWLLLPGLICRATGHAIGPRAAWIGSVFWCGLGFMCLIAVAFRVFWYRGPASFRRRAIAGILLLGITGLDILPTAFLWLLRAMGVVRAILPSMEWWNEQVDGFVYTALWEAHHLCGLIACLVAFLLLREGARQAAFLRQVRYAGVAGLALATAIGSSIHIAFVFAVYVLAWTAIVLVKRWWREAAALAAAGAIGAMLVLPHVLSLRSAGAAGHGAAPAGGPPLQLWVRPFYPLDALLQGPGIHGAWTLALVNALMLPLNYFLELGFFLGTAVIWWRKRGAVQKSLSKNELSLAVLVAASIVVCTFLRSSLIGNNDLGWRGFLLAQFGLLLWSVDVFFEQPRHRLLTALLVLGAAGTVYDLGILRLYPILADAGLVAKVGWMAPDRQLGARNYSARQAYEWIAHATPPGAVIQFDPHVSLQDTSAMLYASRQIAAADPSCFAVFGGDPSLCPPLVARLAPLYPAAGEPAAAGMDAACQSLPVDILIAKDTDAVWADPHSWVWTGRPIFANRFYRAFRCRGR